MNPPEPNDRHRHLPVVPPTKSHATSSRANLLVVALGVASAGCFAASYFRPWWQFMLYAPQYPKGLSLVISLTGMGGDVNEIDLLNHYIGMKHLANAATFERHSAGYGVAAVCLATLLLFMFSGKSVNKWVAIPAVAFPVIFLIDSFYWLYSFGHGLDPKAPLRIGAFTPQMFGNGKIGQFETYATAGVGFWLALAGVACAVVGAFLRARVCAHCDKAGSCTVRCPRAMVLPERQESK